MSAHAKLSASSSHRWSVCHRAPSYEQMFTEPESSKFAQEGVFAHAVAEQDLAKYLGLEVKPLPDDLLHFDTPSLREYVAVYTRQVTQLIDEVRKIDSNAIVLLERRVDFSRWVPEGFGTCDLIIVSRGIVYVVDLKFGQGIKVEAINNSQIRLYGAGAVDMFDHIFDITDIVMIIVQPRLGHVSREDLTKEDLITWADEVIAPAAILAWNGQGNFTPGDHCRWCRGKSVCAARAQENLQLAKFDFAEPDTLTDEAIANVLEKAARLQAWTRDVQDYALSQALRGRKFAGYKLVAGRTTRKFLDPEKVAHALGAAGLNNSDIYAPKELNPLTALEGAVGKKKFVELLGDLIVTAPGKPTLVPVEDKRPEFTPAVSAAADFSNLTRELA